MANIYTGIDIGTYHVKVVIAEPTDSPVSPLRIIGTGIASSKGMRHGYIINAKDATRSVAEALERASNAAGVRIRKARVAIGGVGLDEISSGGEVSLTPSGGEVTARDIDRAIRASEQKSSSQLMNRKVIHAIPLEYSVDENPVLGRPVGMQGSKLSVKTLLVTALEQHLSDIIGAVEAVGIEVEDVMASPLAASLVSLSKPQKMAGVVLANIGAETVSIVIFEDDTPISVKVLPTGAADITNDIALSLKISLTEAEQMKRGAITQTDVSRKKVEDVVASRLKDIFNIIDAHLKSIGRQRLLPAGIVITGGGSSIATAQDIAKATMKLPSQIGDLSTTERVANADATWAVAFGLCRWGYSTDKHARPQGLGEIVKKLWRSIARGVRALMP